MRERRPRFGYYSLHNTRCHMDIKMYLYKSVCLPTLLFGIEIIFLFTRQVIKELESFQGCLMKRSLGLCKFSHHSKLLEALNIQKVSDAINNMTISLWK